MRCFGIRARMPTALSILGIVFFFGCKADSSPETEEIAELDKPLAQVAVDSVETTASDHYPAAGEQERLPEDVRYLTAEHTMAFLLNELYADSSLDVIGTDRIRVLDRPRGEIVTEAEYLEPVVLLEEAAADPDWVNIELPLQRGYAGCIPRSSVSELTEGPYRTVAVVSAPSALVTGAPDGGVILRELRGATVVPVVNTTRNYLQVDLIEGLGWLDRDEVVLFEDSLLPSATNVIGTARSMIGSEYVWGGTTWGTMDCSGFINLVFRMNGYLLKRDCGIQFSDSSGCIIQASEVLPGDLIYISTYQPGASHVGIISRDGHVIHCGSAGVMEIPLDGSTFETHEVVGYKRFTGAGRATR